MASNRQLSELVGRRRELAELGRAFDEVSPGTTWVVELVGEAGIGKSRLLAEACRQADQKGFLVLQGRAAEFEQDIPFAVIVDALNDHVESLGPAAFRGLEADDLRELASILPALSGLGAERRVGDDAQRYRAHYAIRALLERLGKSQPVMLAVDDVHWADAASLEVLVHLMRRFRGGLLIGVASRRTPPQLTAALEDSTRAGFGSRLDLGPLTPDEALALLDPGLDDSVREAVYRDSGGNPFYLEQLGRSGAPRGEPEMLKAQRPRGSRIAPPRVIAAITDSLDRLADGDRVVLEAAAVAGEAFTPGLVAAIAEVNDASALDAVNELVRADLIRTAAAPQRFEFRHPIVRRVVYDGMPAGWRVGAHARAADALASAGASRAEMANHVARSAAAGDEEAIGLLLEAARDVAPRAPLTAGRWTLAAVRLLTGQDDERRARLLGESGALLTSGGGFEEALEALDGALSASHDATALRAGLVAKRAEARRRGGRGFSSSTQLGQALRFRLGAEAPEVAAVRLELAMDRYWHGDFEAVVGFAGEVLARARPQGDLLLVCLAVSLSSLAHAYRCEIDRAVAELEEAEAAFAKLPDERLAERIYLTHYTAEAALRLERADASLTHFRRGREVARVTGQDATARSWSGLAIYAHLMKGEVSEAAEIAADDLDLERLGRDDWRELWLLAADTQAALWAGQSDRALANARELVTRSERGHPANILPGLARLRLGSALLTGADAAGAVEELTPLDEDPSRWLLDLDSAHGWDTLVRAQLALGQQDVAEESVARAESRAAGLPQRVANLACARSAVQIAGGDGDAAVKTAGEAAEVAEAAGNPLLVGRCRVELGRALAAAGRQPDGIVELEAAEQALSECGAVREADAAARALRGLGKRVRMRPRPEREGGVLELSPREREVAAQVAAGKTNREIAATLFLSEKTVESHLSRIYSKLDVHSRAALTAIVAREGAGSQAQGPSPTATVS
jgi:DNA-binding CsgD family transcriptional regulator